jgi:hypothetical protein
MNWPVNWSCWKVEQIESESIQCLVQKHFEQCCVLMYLFMHGVTQMLVLLLIDSVYGIMKGRAVEDHHSSVNHTHGSLI